MLGKRKAQLNLTPIKDRNRIDNDEIQFLSDEQKRIKGNIESYLQANHPEMIEKYQKAAQFYKDKYLPYHIDRTISNMRGADNPIAKSEKQAEEIKRKTLERQAKVTDSAMVKAFSDTKTSLMFDQYWRMCIQTSSEIFYMPPWVRPKLILLNN